MISYFKKSTKESKYKNLENFKPGSWIHMVSPSEDEISQVVAKFDLEMGHLKDALDFYEVPRFELEGKVLYLYFRVPYHSAQGLNTGPLLAIMGDNFFMTVAPKKYDLISTVLESSKLATNKNHRLLTLLLSAINQAYHVRIQDTNRLVNRAAGKLTKINNQDILKLISYEQIFNEFINAMQPNHSVIHQALQAKVLRLSQASHEQMEDVYLALGQLINTCKSSLATVKNLRDAHMVILSNNLNQVLKFFTSLSIILTIPTIVASLYGMNINLPLQNHPLAFIWVITITLIIILGLVSLFNKKNWL